MRIAFAMTAFTALAACDTDPGPVEYTPPSASGLVSVRPFPGPLDVCKVIGENDLTVEYLDDSATLVGCPAGETGAIRDRQRQGGTIVGQEGAWVLISVPDAEAG